MPDDLERDVDEWLPWVARIYPGITPHSAGTPGPVWDLGINDWMRLRRAAKAVREHYQQQLRGGRRRG